MPEMLPQAPQQSVKATASRNYRGFTAFTKFFLLTETHGLGKAKTEYFSTIISQHVSTELVHLGLYCARMLDFSNCWLIFYFFFKKG